MGRFPSVSKQNGDQSRGRIFATLNRVRIDAIRLEVSGISIGAAAKRSKIVL
jgi:hypothetical protein